MNELISVIIPTYKRPEFLIESIKSVVTQTYSDLEIIVVDNNDISSEFYEKTKKISEIDDKRVRIVKCPVNGNGAVARNFGVEVSKGKYIAFLDDDDIFSINKLELQKKYLEDNNIDICLCGFRRFNNSSKVSKEVIPSIIDLSDKLLSMDIDTCAGSTIMMTKESFNGIKGFDIDFYRHQDIEFLYRVSKEYKVGIVKEILSFIREHNGSNIPKRFNKIEEIRLKFLIKFSKDIENSKIREEIYQSHFFYLIVQGIKYKKICKVVKYFLKSPYKIEMIKKIFSFIILKLKVR